MSGKNYIACNIMPMHKSDIGGIEAEKRRELNEYTNDVDLTKSGNNIWYIGEHNSQSCSEIVEQRFRDYNQEIKSNTRCAMNLVFRVSDDFEGNRNDVWKSCLHFVNSQGIEPILAVAHEDEHNSHLECICIPTTKTMVVDHREPVLDEYGNKIYYKSKSSTAQKRYKTKPVYAKDEDGNTIYKQQINYKNIFGTRQKLSSFQTKLAKQVGEQYGLRRGKCRVKTGEKKKTLTDLEYQEKILNKRIISHDLFIKEQETQIENNRKENNKICSIYKKNKKIVDQHKKKLEELEQRVKNAEQVKEQQDKKEQELNNKETALEQRERAVSIKEKFVEKCEILFNKLENVFADVTSWTDEKTAVKNNVQRNKTAFERAKETAKARLQIAYNDLDDNGLEDLNDETEEIQTFHLEL